MPYPPQGGHSVAGVLDIALGYLAAGLSVIPVRADGSKAPAESGWRAYSERQPTPDELHRWFGNGHKYGIGIPGGPASGNLAVLDFESHDSFVAWLKSLSKEAADRTRKCPLARTPGGGAHLYARLEDPVPGGVLASKPHDTRKLPNGHPASETLIEIRANGQQVVAPGSPPSCHPVGKEYEWLREGWTVGGAWSAVPWEEWFEWLERAAELNTYTPLPTLNHKPPDTRPRIPRYGESHSPGSDFNYRGTWAETGLFEEGWVLSRALGDDRGFLTRPGKEYGTSATIGLVAAKDGGHPLFFPFTTHCHPFQHLKGYSRFRVYGILKHSGDWAAAARVLAERGYGSRSAEGIGVRASEGLGERGEGIERKPLPYSLPPTPSMEGTKGNPIPYPPSPIPSLFRFIDSAEFLAGDYRPRWLVPRILVRGQPCVIAGPSKGMKTSLLIDLAVSMATATPFLGAFPVRERVRVAVVSGESGEHTLKETCLRVLQAKQLSPSELTGWLKWEFTLPTFSDLDSMTRFGEALARIEADVVFIDPTYLALGDIDAKNLFEMGRALRTIATVLLKLRPGLTVILVHHANRLLPVGEVMELQHLAYSGLEQFARQFILLNRRELYRNDGEHEMWVRVGGSTGHGGLWAVHVSEGVVDEDFSGRRWGVSVRTPDEADDAQEQNREQQKKDKQRERNRNDEECVLAVIDAEANKGYPGASVSLIGDRVNFGDQRVRDAINRLVDQGVLRKVPEFDRKSGNGAKSSVKNGFGRVEGD